MFVESWILRVSCKVYMKPFGLHLHCKRPEVFMIPWTFQILNSFLNCTYLGFTLSTTRIASSWSLLYITTFTGQRNDKKQHANACNLKTDMVINNDNDSMSHFAFHMYFIVLYRNQRTIEETGKRRQETDNLKTCLQLCGSLPLHMHFRMHRY